MQKHCLTFTVLEMEAGVCRLGKSESVPAWALQGEFFSVTRTKDELSVVCESSLIPPEVLCQRGWRIFQVDGTLDFSLVGILAAISSVLAAAGISIFAISTYDTDYILVQETDYERAATSLRLDGHVINGDIRMC